MAHPTLETIARIAGVSRATVSRVVNNDPRVGAETRERVRQVIREQGYHPNAAARALVRGQSRSIGLAAHEALGTLFSHAYFPPLVQGIADACEQRGYSLVLSPLASQTPEGLMGVWQSGQLDGVVVATAAVGDAFLARLQEAHLPFVLVGPHHARPAIPWVSPDNVAGGRMAAEYLLSLGHRRVAAISGARGLGTAMERLEGFCMAMAAAGAPVSDESIVEGDHTEAGGYAAMERLLSHAPGYEAVFCGNDLTAIGAMRAAKKAGLTVPDDLSVVGFDDVPLARMVDPPLTTIRQPITALGAAAATLLIDVLERPGELPPNAAPPLLPVEIVVRESCRAGR
ncbi:MAG: LacI family transcriptional regulator [Chloroflexi bacterium]|nr:LacI family transcriptional regulator [Chloroflexota bacterium]